jgi:hypothetical protein
MADPTESKPSEDLKAALLAELKLQKRLKQEILDELGEERSPWSDWLAHPVTLLVLGFLFTAVVGGRLTSSWQGAEWTRQQNVLEAQRDLEAQRAEGSKALERKYALVDEVTQAVSETLTAAEDVLALPSYELGPSQQPNRLHYWQETSRMWRIKSKAIRQRIHAQFRNPDVHASLTTIVEKRKVLGRDIMNLIGALTPPATPRQPNGASKGIDVEQAGELVEEITNELFRLTQLMVAEASVSLDRKSGAVKAPASVAAVP